MIRLTVLVQILDLARKCSSPPFSHSIDRSGEIARDALDSFLYTSADIQLNNSFVVVRYGRSNLYLCSTAYTDRPKFLAIASVWSPIPWRRTRSSSSAVVQRDFFAFAIPAPRGWILLDIPKDKYFPLTELGVLPRCRAMALQWNPFSSISLIVLSSSMVNFRLRSGSDGIVATFLPFSKTDRAK